MTKLAPTQTEANQQVRLFMVLGITATFFAIEFVGAIWSKSAVLRADALHLLMDVFALGMAIAAMRISLRAPRGHYTFGFRRAETLAALANATLVVAASIEIIHEGIDSLKGHETPQSGPMLGFAVLALFANGLSAWLIHGAMHQTGHDHHGHDHHGHGHDHHGHGHGHAEDDAVSALSDKKPRGQALNLRGAWLHLMGDALGAIAALVAAVVIRFGGPAAIDPIASFLVAAILLVGVTRLVRDALRVLLEAAPKHLAVDAVRSVILAQPGVASLSNLHVWTLGGGHDALTVQVVPTVADAALGKRVADTLRKKLELSYVTVQVDPPAGTEQRHGEGEGHGHGHGHEDGHGHGHGHGHEDGHEH
jgi:cation diffusion facilitator family transporter